MVSVLCDAPFFDGSWDHLARARAPRRGRPRVPLLAKEFVLDARQIDEARDRGADAVLLIARIVDAPRARGARATRRATRGSSRSSRWSTSASSRRRWRPGRASSA